MTRKLVFVTQSLSFGSHEGVSNNNRSETLDKIKTIVEVQIASLMKGQNSM